MIVLSSYFYMKFWKPWMRSELFFSSRHGCVGVILQSILEKPVKIKVSHGHLVPYQGNMKLFCRPGLLSNAHGLPTASFNIVIQFPRRPLQASFSCALRPPGRQPLSLQPPVGLGGYHVALTIRWFCLWIAYDSIFITRHGMCECTLAVGWTSIVKSFGVVSASLLFRLLSRCVYHAFTCESMSVTFRMLIPTSISPNANSLIHVLSN